MTLQPFVLGTLEGVICSAACQKPVSGEGGILREIFSGLESECCFRFFLEDRSVVKCAFSMLIIRNLPVDNPQKSSPRESCPLNRNLSSTKLSA